MPARLERCNPLRSISRAEYIRTAIFAAHADDRAKQLLPLRLGQLLRVVQQRERANAVVAQGLVVEQDAGDDERPRKRTAAGLVDSRHEACAEPSVEAKKALAAARGTRRG